MCVSVSDILQMNPVKFNSYSTFSVFLMEGQHFASSSDSLFYKLFVYFIFYFFSMLICSAKCCINPQKKKKKPIHLL